MNSHYWRNATPEQLNFWENTKAIIAYATITPIFYQGLIAGSEFLTYNAGKLYLGLEFSFMDSPVALYAPAPYIALYDMALDVILQKGFVSTVWDTTGAALKYSDNGAELYNVWFSKIAVIGGVTYMKFNGYRLNT